MLIALAYDRTGSVVRVIEDGRYLVYPLSCLLYIRPQCLGTQMCSLKDAGQPGQRCRRPPFLPTLSRLAWMELKR